MELSRGEARKKLNYAKRTQREKPDVGKGEAGENTELELLAKEDSNKQLQGTPQSKPEYPVRRSRNICKGFRNGCKWYRSRTPGEPQRTKSEQREIAKKGGVEKWRVDALVWVWPLIRAGRRKNYLPVLFGGFMEKM